MLSRPAFFDRLLRRVPDPYGLRSQLVLGSAALAALFGLVFVWTAHQLDSRRNAEVQRERALAIATVLAPWLDGDAHAGLGDNPGKRLSDASANIELMLRSSEYPGTVRTLRATKADRAVLSAQPDMARPDALEVVIQVGAGAKSKTERLDYRPEMAPALLEGKATVASSGTRAFAPILDSWGATTALVVVDGPSGGPLWRRAVFLLASTLFATAFVAGAGAVARSYAQRLADGLAGIEAAAEDLARGQSPGPIAVRRVPREIGAVASSLDLVRARLEALSRGEQPPEVPEPRRADGARPRPRVGEPVEFELALLLQQLVEPARKVALSRRLEFSMVFPDGIPSRLIGHPVPLYQALDGLLRNAFRATEQGSVTLRVNRAPDATVFKLRFEVADTGPGIAFKEQQELQARLATAPDDESAGTRDALHQASVQVSAMGGELSFESQPGHGSRFSFTISFQSNAPLTGTAFRQRPPTVFQPRPQLRQG